MAAEQKDGRRLEETLRENEELRLLAQKLEEEKVRLVREKVRLETASNGLRERLRDERQDRLRLETQLSDVESESRQCSARFVEVEQRASDLTSLYVAIYRLHDTSDRKQVLTAVQEIVINLIGSEEFGIFEVDQASGALELISSFGLKEDRYQNIPLGSGIIGRSAQTGEMYFSEDGETDGAVAPDGHLTACIPLRVGDEVIGLIAVFRLLPQKGGRLEGVDRRLFDVLSSQAASALSRPMPEGRSNAPGEPTS